MRLVGEVVRAAADIGSKWHVPAQEASSCRAWLPVIENAAEDFLIHQGDECRLLKTILTSRNQYAIISIAAITKLHLLFDNWYWVLASHGCYVKPIPK
jgi:hypothetical protein